MSLGKAIYYGKEKRKPYYDSRRFDWSCRNHKGCAWCKSNRLYSYRKWKAKADAEIREFTHDLSDD